MKALLSLIVLIIIAGAAWLYLVPKSGAPGAQTPTAVATFMCDSGKTITASFFSGPAKPPANPGEPPIPGGSVSLVLSDGRSMTLPQTLSADGARYANSDESLIFWNKGRGATITEANVPTYSGCLEIMPDPGGLQQVYENGTEGFSIRYPNGYTVDQNYKYQELGPGKDIGGVKFTIDPSIATGTNLSSDTYLSVEEIPQATSCDAAMFLDSGSMRSNATTTTIDGTEYSVASSTGAGAGNRYEETVYALPGTNPCVAVRYFIHYGVIENYPAGAVQQFDEAALKSQFDAMRKTLVTQ